MSDQHIRQPVVDGLFYPRDPDELRTTIRTYMDRVPPDHKSTRAPWGAIVPHAGYKYSGQVATYAYQLLGDQAPSRIVIIGPSHREYFSGCSVYDGTTFNTPLGPVEVDNDFGEQLTGGEGMELSERGHLEEHAIEVQVPFLQYIYSHHYSIVPITMGTQTPETVENLVNVLVDVIGESDVIIVSSDLSHYYAYNKAVVMDSRFRELVSNGDVEGLWNALDRHEIEACGFGPVMILLELSKRWETPNPVVLHYANSGDVTGDRSQVVGYMSAVFEKEPR